MQLQRRKPGGVVRQVHIPHNHHIHLTAQQVCDALKAPLLLVLQAAQSFLKGVLAANAAAFACMKALASAALSLDYAKIECVLSTNVLSSSVAASLKFTISGKQFAFDSTINLSDLTSIIGDVYNKAVDYLKQLFPVEEQATRLVQQGYSADALTDLLQPENVYLLQAKLGNRNKALEPDSEVAQQAADAAQAAGMVFPASTQDNVSGPEYFNPALSNAQRAEDKVQEVGFHELADKLALELEKAQKAADKATEDYLLQRMSRKTRDDTAKKTGSNVHAKATTHS